jgi:hypothetical protein
MLSGTLVTFMAPVNYRELTMIKYKKKIKFPRNIVPKAASNPFNSNKFCQRAWIRAINAAVIEINTITPKTNLYVSYLQYTALRVYFPESKSKE